MNTQYDNHSEMNSKKQNPLLSMQYSMKKLFEKLKRIFNLKESNPKQALLIDRLVEGRSSVFGLPTSDSRLRTSNKHRTIALFLVAIFLQTLVPYNQLWANNNGPTAPEAASFEPVDATDMVNLLTGDLSYVLPILNIPSPEGGYPLSLSYHAGIAMDQEASWVGLGWNINPGVINRSVNGYPDDWRNGNFTEYFYDVGGTETQSYFSINYTSLATGGASFGASFSWGSNKSFGGDVNFGAGGVNFGVGSSGASVGFGINDIASVDYGISANGVVSFGVNVGIKNTPFSVGGSLGSDGSYGFSAGRGNFELGLDVDSGGQASLDASYLKGARGKKSGVGLSFSSSGITVKGRIKGYGTGLNFAFSKSITMDDYNIKSGGWSVPYFIPIPWAGGFLHGSFGKQKVTFDLSNTVRSKVNGALCFDEPSEVFGRTVCSYKYFDYSVDIQVNESHEVNSLDHIHEQPLNTEKFSFDVKFVEDGKSYMDIYEIPLNNQFNMANNNAAFANYDNYHVTAQGISGSIAPRYYEPGALIGLNRSFEDYYEYRNFRLTYNYDNTESRRASRTRFLWGYDFYFENEYASSQISNSIRFEQPNNSTDIFSYVTSDPITRYGRRKTGRHVEVFLNKDIIDGTAYSRGFMKANSTINYNDLAGNDEDGIGGFAITAPDGKTYHYSIPVYNYEVVTRQFGTVPDRPNENQAFYEKRQLKKYATHWLLTAITGADFVDNGDHIVDKDDLGGYWTTFDYGKWTDGYIWKTPYGKSYNENYQTSRIKNYTWGRKDVYYLDKVTTRTHTALFVKSAREDSKGKAITYNGRLDKDTTRSFSLPSQSLLKLDKIVLINNDDLEEIDYSKQNEIPINSEPSPNSTSALTWFEGAKIATHSQQNNVLDIGDFSNEQLSNLREKSLKTVIFNYDYDLVYGTPNSDSGRLTLNSVELLGKNETNYMPSYRFEYNNLSGYNQVTRDIWGYDAENPENWSLRKIKNPIGTDINIIYESDQFRPVLSSALTYSTQYDVNSLKHISGSVFEIDSELANHLIKLDDTYGVYETHNPIYPECNLPCRTSITISKSNLEGSYFNGTGTVETERIGVATIDQKLSATKYRLRFDLDRNPKSTYGNMSFINLNVRTHGFLGASHIKGGGLRVKSIESTDGITSQTIEYAYNKVPGFFVPEETSSGVCSYVPTMSVISGSGGGILPGVPFYNTNLNIEGSTLANLLPSPNVNYGNVETIAKDTNGKVISTTKYEFNVLPAGATFTPTSISFGDYLKLECEHQLSHTNSLDKEVEINDFNIIDNLSLLGQVKKITQLNSENQIISSTENNYETIENIDQGIDSETFQTYKEVDYFENNYGIKDKWQLNNTTRSIYPSVLKSTKVESGGFSALTYFEKHDEITGQTTETKTTSSTGVELITKMEPAYTKYPEMGSKTDDIEHKNMLTQEAATYQFIKSGDSSENSIELINAQITTWKSWSPYDIWRKHSNYVWKGALNENGAFKDYQEFGWGNEEQDSGWQRVSEILRYDNYSMPLEIEDINGNKVTTKMGDNDTKVFAVGNVAYDAMFYSGAEDVTEASFYSPGDGITNNFYFSGDVTLGPSGAIVTSIKKHTGKYSVQVTANNIGFRVRPQIGGVYRTSVWVHKDNYTNTRLNVNGVAKNYNSNEIVFAGDWVQLNFNFSVGSNQLVYVTTTSGTAYFDDFRLHPIASSMTSYVYNEWDELTYILGANNMATKYEYDAAGRLKATLVELEDGGADNPGGFKPTSEIYYNYKKSK